uniref:UBC core domain-containing protein n=1 Tax=viral metagenome TaxID=1070528 RepID=A0A6C0EKT7_9ZZZZ
MYEKRIKKEILNILDLYGNVSVIKEDLQYIIKIGIESNNNASKSQTGKIITIHLNSHYPFQPPPTLINNTNYIDMLCIKDTFVKEKIQSIYKVGCLCSKSIICPNIWSPSNKLENIVDEIKKNNKIIKNIYCMKFTYMLCRSYGIYCLEIPELICKNYI